MKLRNTCLVNEKGVYVCGDVVDFDSNGVAVFTKEDAYKAAQSLTNFFKVAEPKKEENKEENPKKEDNAVPVTPEKVAPKEAKVVDPKNKVASKTVAPKK